MKLSSVHQSQVFHTYEMYDLLKSTPEVTETIPNGFREFSEYFIETILGSWIGIVRHCVLELVEEERGFDEKMKDGRVCMCFRPGLAPYGWTRADVETQIFYNTGEMPVKIIRQTLCGIEKQLKELRGGLAFEPLGQIEESGDDELLVVRLWEDFLSV